MYAAGSGAVPPGYHAALDPIAAAAAAAGHIPAAERLNIPTDPLLRLQLASAGLSAPGLPGDCVSAPGVSAAEMSHTHTHSHTHLHLHQPESTSAAAASLFPPLHPLFASQLLQSSALNLSGRLMSNVAILIFYLSDVCWLRHLNFIWTTKSNSYTCIAFNG